MASSISLHPSDLTDSGYVTNQEALDWVASIVSKARAFEQNDGIRINVYAYRGLTEYLAVDIVVGMDSAIPLTFHASGRTQLDAVDPCVFDMSEAIHLTGLIAQSLGVMINLGMPIEPNDMATIRSRTSAGH